jgi:hypothetical protein
MKSPHPLSPSRVTLRRSEVETTYNGDRIIVTVQFVYEPWEPSTGQDALREQANALRTVRNIITLGSLPLHFAECPVNERHQENSDRYDHDCRCADIHDDLESLHGDMLYDEWKESATER